MTIKRDGINDDFDAASAFPDTIRIGHLRLTATESAICNAEYERRYGDAPIRLHDRGTRRLLSDLMNDDGPKAA